MSSKALALLVTGLNTLGDGLKMMAAELQEIKPETRTGTGTGAAKKEMVKETKTETAPEIDEAKLRSECIKIMQEKVLLPGNKPKLVAALAKFGAKKVGECPTDKLPELKAAFEAVKEDPK